MKAGERNQQEQGGESSPPSQQPIQGIREAQQPDLRETFGHLTINDGSTQEGPGTRFMLDRGPFQEIERQLTTSENEAMNAHVQQIVDVSAQRGPFQAMLDPQIGDQHIFVNAAASNHFPTVRRRESALVPREELFRNTASRLAGLRRRSSSSEWETIDSVFEESNNENLESVEPLPKGKQGAETILAKAIRKTQIPPWMAYHLNKAKQRPSDLLPTAARVKEYKKQDSPQDFVSQISLEPKIIIHAGDNGPELYPISPIPIDYSRAYVSRPNTPSIRSNGSELDCSSPLFLKSCEAAVRGNRDSSKVCGETPTFRPDTRILKWLESIDISADLEPECQEGIDTKADIESREAFHNDAESKIEDLGVHPFKFPQRAFEVLQDDHVRNGPRNQSPSGIAVPSLKTLKDISNLRRPGYLAKTSFATPKPAPARRSIPRLGGPILPTPIKKAHAQPQNMALRTARQPACVSSERLTQLLNSLRWQGQITSMFSFEPSIERHDHFEYALACLEGRVPLYVACKPTNVRFQRLTPLQKRIQRRALQRDFAVARALVERANELTTSTFSFEPDEERRKHFEFTLARLEGRVGPRTPSPIRRFVHPGGYYGEHVEWEKRPTRMARPVAKRARPLDGLDNEEFGLLRASEDGRGEEDAEALEARKPVESEEVKGLL